MRTMTTTGAVLLLAVGVGRGDPPSGPATPASPVPSSAPAPVASVPPIPPEILNWKRTERVDTPAPPAKPADAGDKGDAKKLKEEFEKLLKEKEPPHKPADKADPPDERTRLHNKLNDLVDRLDQQKKSPKPAVPPKPADGHDPHSTTPPKPVLPEGGTPIDLVRAAGNLYKSGDTDGAFQLLKTVDATQLPKEDRAFADYVRAACLRRMGKTTEAVKVYRAIADAKDDTFLAESAVVQLTAIKSAQELEAQLEQLKSRRKPK